MHSSENMRHDPVHAQPALKKRRRGAYDNNSRKDVRAGVPMEMVRDHAQPSMSCRVQRRLFEILESPKSSDVVGRVANRVLVGLILANIAAAILESVEALYRRYGGVFQLLETLSLAIFIIEYGCRVWV